MSALAKNYNRKKISFKYGKGSFLSGVFYSIDKLPQFFQTISHINPFFYMIDGFRYGFLGKSDGSINLGLIYLSILSVLIWYVAFFLYKKGYKIKS